MLVRGQLLLLLLRVKLRPDLRERLLLLLKLLLDLLLYQFLDGFLLGKAMLLVARRRRVNLRKSIPEIVIRHSLVAQKGALGLWGRVPPVDV